MPQTASKQTAFDLRAPAPKTFNTFLLNQSNEEAVSWLRKPSKWQMPILAVIGMSGSGKSHLLDAFVTEHSARKLQRDIPIPIGECRGQFVALDDAQQWSEESLFILMNMALNGDIPNLLLTDRHSPSDWDIRLPDLRSRLKNIPVVRLAAPNEDLLEPIIKTLFSEQGRQIDSNVVEYILVHCARDISSLEADIEHIERTARAQKADVTKRFVAKVLRERRA